MPHTAHQTVTQQEGRAPDVHRLDVTHVHGDAYDIDIRAHQLLVDQPLEAGGADVTPSGKVCPAVV